MSDQDEPEQRDALDRRMDRADFEETTTAAIGVGLRSLRTIWASMVATPRVIESVLRKSSEYTPPIPLFIVLFALQLAAAALFSLPGAPTTEVLRDSTTSPERIEVWLAGAAAGTSEADVNAAIQRAYDFALWPITILSALPTIFCSGHTGRAAACSRTRWSISSPSTLRSACFSWACPSPYSGRAWRPSSRFWSVSSSITSPPRGRCAPSMRRAGGV